MKVSDEHLSAKSPPAGVVTIMFTDIVGSTTLGDKFVEDGEIDGDKKESYEFNAKAQGVQSTM